jgi:hypothetical protein
MLEEPPRPARAGSAASPTSGCMSSETSRAIFAAAPARMALSAPTRAKPSRALCQVTGASGSASSAESAAATAAPFSPNADSVPAGPPS